MYKSYLAAVVDRRHFMKPIKRIMTFELSGKFFEIKSTIIKSTIARKFGQYTLQITVYST